uniref:Glycosyl transferases group 1 family protein n=1 Tax=Trepomonas sp. PC1 TaxID=1076344 RepID=A0A146KDS5_9EUKA|eukprot:JAP94358.1 Glycosyl transferases group 1 family protein [Trepomonas sp. PC1]
MRKQKLKIGIFTAGFGQGGTERVSQILSDILAKEGHEVVVVTGPIQKTDYKMPENVKRLVLQNYNEMNESQAIADEQFDVVIFQEYWVLKNYENIDLFINRGLKVIAIDHNVYLAAILSDGLLAYADNDGGSTHQRQVLRHRVYPRLHALVTLSPFDQFIWKQAGVRARYIQDPIVFENVPIEPRPQNVIAVGRLTDKDKQTEYALQVMKRLKVLNKQARLYLLGGTDSSIDNFIKNKKLTNVVNVGYTLDVQKYYRNSSVLILTSRFEGFSMVIIEAISQGVAVVSFSQPYLVLMKCGVVQVKKQDYKEMAFQVNRLLKDETLRQKIVQEGQECIKKLGSEVAPKWNELLDEVVNDQFKDSEDEISQKEVEDILDVEVQFLRQLKKNTKNSVRFKYVWK